MPRENGYKVTLTLFLPVDTRDVNDQVAKAQAVQAAQGGDLSKIATADVMKFEHRFTSREKPATSAGDVEPRPALQEPPTPQPEGGPITTPPAEADDPPPPGSPASRARKAA